MLPRNDSRGVAQQFSLPPFMRRWITHYARRRLRKELERYLRPPELRLTPFRRRNSRGGSQTFRSLVQVNVYRNDQR
jgi:hypothetical protein